MPREHLTGFFGKLPTAGDFVGRNLPAAYVRFWDRWIARHLSSPLAEEPLEAHPMLRFMLGSSAGGPVAGVVMASTDSAGRCFPLTLAAPIARASTGLAVQAADWFDAIEEAGDAARCSEIDADQLERRLAALPFPAAPAQGEAVAGMAFWTGASEPGTVDPESPGDALARLLARQVEVG